MLRAMTFQCRIEASQLAVHVENNPLNRGGGGSGGYSHTLAIRGRAALQGMVFRLCAHKQGLEFKDFFLNRV